jgi:hypothetical protein
MMNKQMIWDGQGPIYFGTYDPVKGTPEMGYLTNLVKIGCANSSFVTTPSIEYDTIKETCSGQKLDLSRRVKAKSLSVKLSMVQFDTDTFARAFFSEALAVNAGSVTDEELPDDLVDGQIVFLKYPKASAIVLTDSSATPVTLQEGTHYKVIDADQSTLQMLDISAMTLPIKAAYSNDTHSNIAVMTKTGVTTGILFTGKNQDGDRGRVVIPKIDLGIDGDWGWISDSASPLGMSGPALYCQELDTPDSEFGPFMQVKWMPGA